MFPGEEESSNVHLLLLYFKIIGSPYNIYPFLTERVHSDLAGRSHCPERQR